MVVDLFCCTYGKDAKWLEYMLRSVQKFAKGYRHCVVVYPTRDVDVLKPICDRFSFVRQHTFEEGLDGHAHMNAIKTSCDLYSDAEYFCHIDSDCVLFQETRPDQFFTNGKPDIVFDYYKDMPPKDPPWQQITCAALGIKVEVETMRQFAFLFPRWLYKATRDRVELIHGIDFVRYVLNAPNLGDAFHGYSEFNALGCTAYYFFSDKFQFYYGKGGNVKPDKMKQFWSHWVRQQDQTKANEVFAEIERITEGWDRRHILPLAA